MQFLRGRGNSPFLHLLPSFLNLGYENAFGEKVETNYTYVVKIENAYLKGNNLKKAL